jgi:multiple sugar transport system ATP-binding protein
MAQIELSGIQKVYDNGFHAVHDFSMSIEKGEFIVLVGPSGCGKSTTLRMIAGLEAITEGKLSIGGMVSNHRSPRDRGVAMVFQSYALYPHMTVYENMGFGLSLKGLDEDIIEARVKNIARILGLEPYLDRFPRELSGGQRQRVAVGRAIIRKVEVFLMDEPLSNLDAKQRVTMRAEIAQIHNRVGATTIYVTHDQTEAMTLADRIVVMKDGYVQQIGTPKELYFKPANRFVAGFIGEPPMNFIEGGVDLGGKPGVLGFRPENVLVLPPGQSGDERVKQSGGFAFSAEIELTEILGDSVNLYMSFNGNDIIVKLDIIDPPEMGETRGFFVPKEHLYRFDAESGAARYGG